ncbi:hypothetical protein GCM10010218_21080 [Streptomyces mashuensis]|uniref:Uncharacterized protein n=1 Tax=Streptomyces mashuensis TaxID=33904 RepID=A0A919ECB8_9ACTN|nr:hypothetical protein [Streptomyces mashuensis]GHF39591.1 hypothetical protein GCM10010218_21080 [Streptomyces mashuensis]
MTDLVGGTGGRVAHSPRTGPAQGLHGEQPSPTRHPLVAAAMVLPMAVFLTVVFGGWDALVTQASSVAGLLGR